jgi:hypothetical protein
MNPEIKEAKENFKRWFIGTIDLLCKEEFTGIPLLMISFPLFERYAEAIKIDMFQAFCNVFHLRNRKEALIVWKSFRHGLLHKASFNTKVYLKDYKSTEYIYQCGVKDDISKEVHIEQNEMRQWTIFISPNKFARKVIELVLDNFEEFYKANEDLCPFSSIHQVEELKKDGYDGICDSVAPTNNISNGYSGFNLSDNFVGHTDSHGILDDDEMKDSCQSIKIDRYEGKQTYYDVWTTANLSNRSLKNVEILVILFDHKNTEIDRGIGVIPEIQSGQIGYVRVILENGKGDYCDHSKIIISKCIKK